MSEALPTDPALRDRVKDLLKAVLGRGWTIARPRDGWAETAFVATYGDRQAFVKVNVHVPVLQRLAVLGITPPILAAGERDGLSYVIQEFVEAPYPEPSWFAEHLHDLASLARTYQQDKTLQALLAAQNLTDFPDDLRWAKRSFQTLARAFQDLGLLQRASPQWLAQLAEVRGMIPVATHGDLSRKNLLPASGRIFLVDWDQASLSDPMRDLGPMLWWYIPPARWPALFTAYGTSLGDALVERVYWWSARTSLEVAHGLLEHGYRDRAMDFLEDFLAAADRKGNPHARY